MLRRNGFQISYVDTDSTQVRAALVGLPLGLALMFLRQLSHLRQSRGRKNILLRFWWARLPFQGLPGSTYTVQVAVRLLVLIELVHGASVDGLGVHKLLVQECFVLGHCLETLAQLSDEALMIFVHFVEF